MSLATGAVAAAPVTMVDDEHDMEAAKRENICLPHPFDDWTTVTTEDVIDFSNFNFHGEY